MGLPDTWNAVSQLGLAGELVGVLRPIRRTVRLAVRDENGRFVGAAPWFQTTSPTGATVLASLGGGQVCTDYVGLLATREHETPVTQAVANWLCDPQVSPSWDWLHLSGVDEHDSGVQRLQRLLANADCQVHQDSTARCWRIHLPDTWEDYLATLSKSHRKQVRRFERRSLDSGRAVLRTAASHREVAQAMDLLADLHQRRRTSLGQPGCFACPQFDGFLRKAAERLFATGQLQLHWLDLEERPVAAEFHLQCDGVTYAYQAGVEPAALDEEPGRLINIATLKKAIQDGQHGFDFLRGDEPYKAHWRAHPRGLVDYRIASPRAAARVRHGAWLAGKAVKQWVKSSLTMVGLQ